MNEREGMPMRGGGACVTLSVTLSALGAVPRRRAMHFPVRRDVALRAHLPDGLFSSRGDLVFVDPGAAVRVLEASRESGSPLRMTSTELFAAGVLHEVQHASVGVYRQRTRSYGQVLKAARLAAPGALEAASRAYLTHYPTPALYRDEDTVDRLFVREGSAALDWVSEELLLLHLADENPALEALRPVVSGAIMPPAFRAAVSALRAELAEGPPFGPRGETLFDVLLAPIREAPHSILAQLAYLRDHFGLALGLLDHPLFAKLALAQGLLEEELAWLGGRPVGFEDPKLSAMSFSAGHGEEPERFTDDRAWMPCVVMIAKNAYVWLDQLSRRYGRAIATLGDIPQEELELLASRGINTLWLIGIFERSQASRSIKHSMGNPDALASAYALSRYDVADELGGYGAYLALRDGAHACGVRLAADMVPNHTGLDSRWVVEHPDWFIQTREPPYPGYSFTGPDVSSDGRVSIRIEDGYYSKTDAAVVFQRRDAQTGDVRYIYHGNDGTSMPWNDTAQLDFLRADVRRAVIDTILHVARMFPVIRFDAAMTIAKRHVQRLWYPLPGHGGGVPSRAAFAIAQEDFDRALPEEFWREVVEIVGREAPDTLLLAEAFWMMEGYFVRSLGMHRVYNSAFMNMLKREENGAFRDTLRNVLAFDPKVLERFVNFMNNPDEETAAVQFGSGDKYFVVATLLATLPGLPMIGHGQLEGFREKYGMEYRRAMWDEPVDEELAQRHERQLYPLLRQRGAFASARDFWLFDLVTGSGEPAHSVFAYVNHSHETGQRFLVAVHNAFARAEGRVHWSAPAKRHGHTVSVTLVEALGLALPHGSLVSFRDQVAGLEYLRWSDELRDGGLALTLEAYEVQVFTDFRVLSGEGLAHWVELARRLEGRGTPSLARALAHLVQADLLEAVASLTATVARASRLDTLAAAYGAMRVCVDAVARRTGSSDVLERWVVEDGVAFGLARAGVDSARAAHASASARMLLEAPPKAPASLVLEAFTDARGAAWLGVHRAGGRTWFSKEAFESLVAVAYARDALAARRPHGPSAEQLVKAAVSAEYDATQLVTGVAAPLAAPRLAGR